MAPRAAIVTGPASPSESHQPIWIWQSGGGGGVGVYRVSVDDPDLETSAFGIMGTQWQAPWRLRQGGHIFYIQERDAAGRWSPMASYCIVGPTLP